MEKKTHKNFPQISQITQKIRRDLCEIVNEIDKNNSAGISADFLRDLRDLREKKTQKNFPADLADLAQNCFSLLNEFHPSPLEYKRHRQSG